MLEAVATLQAIVEYSLYPRPTNINIKGLASGEI